MSAAIDYGRLERQFARVPAFATKEESLAKAKVLESEFGPRLRRWRHYRELKSLTDLSHPAGFSDSSLRKYERGETDPPLTTLYRMALVLGISVQQLVHEDPPRESWPRIEQSIREEDKMRAMKRGDLKKKA